ncbi:3-hydroxyacyl-CoA dehydrogenase NAD-binding domain-containing protein [Variovorax sp. JS1663]|uniref:3-hydroxyacyl-CoA dehydrogenase NAD-binding domain-containing protein n=1 Tax=Variovorax sp. JS1663 TaxID=1851577 RepID=UPI000B3496E2|nr:3-hydroxyacyl-CoA dehydrogenase NAD-binding domain-containing protein [Variovorax sp. JS1663]OUM01598.1 hydroxylacyl-CoA dehydrogenase [Variovorax sp. JS1663]
MSHDDTVLKRYREVAVVGAGVIGASWVAVFLAHGLRVRVSDPREGVDAEVRGYVAQAMPTLAQLGAPLAQADFGERLVFEPDLERAVAAADLVQENGPERIDFKRGLWRRIEQAAPAAALFLSSSSALPATEQASEMSTPERLLIGHPFNPPHIIPLVEVVPGKATSANAVQAAVEFYRAVGKVPKVLRKEVSGFVANRLQSAIFRECVALVAAGVVTIDELDDIVTHSVGLRWAVDGPFASFHLGGGDGGLRSFVQQFGPGMEKRWASMQREVRFDEATTRLLFEQADASYGRHTRAELEGARDARQIAILQALARIKG